MKVVIAGGVAAGMSAASKIKRERPDAQVTVFEKGGETSYGACGLPYYVSGVNEEEDLLRIRKKEEFLKAGIDLRLFHEVTGVHPEHKTASVTDLHTGQVFEEPYDYFVAAVGASPIIPPVRGVDLPGIYTLKTIEDGNRIRQALGSSVKDVVIVGGGYIGMELVEAFLVRKVRVRVLERLDRLLSNFDEEFGQDVLSYLEGEGVLIHLEEPVLEFLGGDRVTGVVTSKGSYAADLVVLCAGVRPNTEFLRCTGVNLLSNGAVLVNSYMESSIPGIYAGGDCASVTHKLLDKSVYLPLGTNANKQGRYIGENILGGRRRFRCAIGTAMMKIGALELGRTGLTKQEALAHAMDCSTVTVVGKDHAPYYPGGSDLKIKVAYETETGVLLGAQLLGRQGAALRTDVFAVAISKGMTAMELGETDLGYAPPYAMPWDMVQIACNAVKPHCGKKPYRGKEGCNG